jgi:hypothetical protein
VGGFNFLVGFAIQCGSHHPHPRLFFAITSLKLCLFYFGNLLSISLPRSQKSPKKVHLGERSFVARV